MNDFKLRFAQCSTTGDVSSCKFSRVREGLIVALLSIGTLIGALSGAPYVLSPQKSVHPVTTTKQHRRFLRSSDCNVAGVCCLHHRCNYSGHRFHLLGSGCSWSTCQGLGVGGLSITVPIICFWTCVWFNSVSDLANLQCQAETAPPQIRGVMT